MVQFPSALNPAHLTIRYTTRNNRETYFTAIKAQAYTPALITRHFNNLQFQQPQKEQSLLEHSLSIARRLPKSRCCLASKKNEKKAFSTFGATIRAKGKGETNSLATWITRWGCRTGPSVGATMEPRAGFQLATLDFGFRLIASPALGFSESQSKSNWTRVEMASID